MGEGGGGGGGGGGGAGSVLVVDINVKKVLEQLNEVEKVFFLPHFAVAVFIFFIIFNSNWSIF